MSHRQWLYDAGDGQGRVWHDVPEPKQHLRQGCMYPKTGTFIGCHPDQVDEFNEASKMAGVPTEHTPEGDPVLRSNWHQRQYERKVLGKINKQDYM